jgi:hypothetical protein
MPNVRQNWKQFVKDDGTIVKCMIDGGYLERVVIEDLDGNSLDIPPDMVDIKAIETALGVMLKVH